MENALPHPLNLKYLGKMPFLTLSWAELLSNFSLSAVVGPFFEAMAAQEFFALHSFLLHFPLSEMSPLIQCEAQWPWSLWDFHLLAA